jgi:fucose permease
LRLDVITGTMPVMVHSSEHQFGPRSAVTISIGSFIFIAGFGFWGTVLGILLPEIKVAFSLNYSATGFAFLIGVIPSLAANFLAGMLYRALPQKSVIFAAALVTVACLFVQSVAQVYALFIASMVVLRFMISIYNVGAATFLTEAWLAADPGRVNRHIGLLHVMYALGCIVATLLSGWFVSFFLEGRTVSFYQVAGWRWSYLAAVIPLSVPVALYLSVKSPARANEEGSHFRAMFSLLRNPVLIPVLSALAFYVGAEVSLGVWIVTFCESALGLSKETAAFYLFIYFILLMGGRFIGSRFLSPKNQGRFIIVSTLSSFVVLVPAVIFKNPLLFSMSGLTFSMMFPSFHSRAVRQFPGESGLVNSILYLYSTIGATLLPFLTGVSNDLLGVEMGLVSIPVWLVPIMPLLMLAEIINRNQARR